MCSSDLFWVTLDHMDKHPAVMMLLFTAVPVSRYQQIRIYESPELMGAFLGVMKDGQVQGVLNREVSSKVLLDIFMGLTSRLMLMHRVRREQRPLTQEFEPWFRILWRALTPED